MFQFQCPGGHLLQGEPSQAGQQCQCPVCNVLFIIPQPLAPAPAPEAGPAADQQAQPAEAFPTLIGPPGSRGRHDSAAEAAPDPMAPVSDDPQAPISTPTQAAPAEPLLYHIPCPNGHELEVPEEMLRQDVLCPICNAQFHLRMKDSVEYKKKKQEEQEKKDRKAGKAWLHGSIAIATVVLLFLLFLIIYEATK